MNKFLLPVALIVLATELMLAGPPVVEAVGDPFPPAVPVEAPGDVTDLALEPKLLIEGLVNPTDIVGAPADDRLFVVEKSGRVRIIDDGELVEAPYLDISRWVGSVGNEQGMLSLLFHPEYTENGRVFLFFTDVAGTSHLVEIHTSENDPNVADIRSLRPILSVPQFGQYHQSGSMFFGPDGYLWLSLGDGGGIGDPNKNGQNPYDLNATIIRIDVDRGHPYSVPSDNPFVESGAGAPEVWAYGLRNPWRITFDEETGLIYIPDVGQEGFEELNVIPLTEGGHNFGWSISEGTGCYAADQCDLFGQTMPVYSYAHNGNGCAMIGGRVYRGELMPRLQGHFFMADFCLGWIRSVVVDTTGTLMVKDWTRARTDRLGTVTTMGSDRHGELYVANLEGEIWRLELEAP